MMPIIQPLNIPSVPPTEYQKERAAFAEMEVGFRMRKGIMQRISALIAALT